jgi:hypothetical protein
MTSNATNQEVISCGNLGAAVWSGNGKRISSLAFASPQGEVTLVPVAGQGYWYSGRGGWSRPANLLNARGAIAWTAPAEMGVDDTTANDFLDAGTPQMVVGYNGSTGLSFFMGDGTLRWNRPESNVWHVDSFRDSAQKPWRIVHSNAHGQITVRDIRGNILSQKKPPFYVSDFNMMSWPTKNGPTHLLALHENSLAILNVDGTLAKSFPTPPGTGQDNAWGQVVSFKPGAPPYVAFLLTPDLPNGGTSVIEIFDAAGKRVLLEKLPEVCSSLAVISPRGKGQRETLLVGGNDHIWRY